jgi:hypothetical protein
MTSIRRRVATLLCITLGFVFLVFQTVAPVPRADSPPLAQNPTCQIQTSGCSPAPSPSVGGQWSSPVNLGVVTIHTHMLPNGKVLFWSRDKQADGSDVSGHCWTYIWDPGMNAITGSVFNSTTNMFCSGHSFLPDGRLLVTGGHLGRDGLGDQHTNIFDFNANTWSAGLPDMNAGRWYPTTCPLGNGETVVVSGETTPAGPGNVPPPVFNTTPQVWQTNGSWRTLTSAVQNLDLFPWMLLAPNGQVFNSGPGNVASFLKTSGSGAWTSGPTSSFPYRDYGSSVMYDDGKVLITGGGTPTATTEVINLSRNNPAQSDNPAWRSVGSMAYARRQMNLTILPDGKLLATGGTSGGGFTNCNGSVLAAEIWDPTSTSWSRMACMQTQRLYHSTAILLPDGRVLSGGGGLPPSTIDSMHSDIDHTDIEIYSPPYLFKGARPTIASCPSPVNNGQQVFVGTPDAASIANVTMVRLSSVTHAFNQDQRINYLSFRQATGGLNVTVPGSGNLCPPGYYMLFILNSNGVPSVASIIQVTVPSSPSNAIDDQRFFTRQQFYDILLRDEDAGGLAFWTNQITQCGNDPNCIPSQRTLVSRAFWDSTEFKNRVLALNPQDPLFPNPPNGLEFDPAAFIGWCYKIYLARQGDPGGLSYWTNNLNNCIAANPGNSSQCYNNVISAFITSAEYRNRFYNP